VSLSDFYYNPAFGMSREHSVSKL